MQDPRLKVVYERLIKVAQDGQTISYSELVKDCDLRLNLRVAHQREELVSLLDEIGRREKKAGRPLLNALVVMAKFGLPSVGFYRLAQSLDYGEPKELRRTFFAVDQIRECHKHDYSSVDGQDS